MHLKSAVLNKVPGILHAFGSISEPIPAPFAKKWQSLQATWTQVHGTQCAELTQPGQKCGEADCQFTFLQGLPAAVMHADCVPILLARRDGKAVAAVHAGWKGTRARILRALWAELEKRGEKPGSWVAGIGPAIGACCYEVSAELADDFAREFAAFGPNTVVPVARRLDLPAINAAELKAIGIGQVEVLQACTKCSSADPMTGTPLFHSYRREKSSRRQYSMIQRNA